MLTVGSLFSGIGLLDYGMEQAGFKVMWRVENNAQCRRLLKSHDPDCPMYGDVREFIRLTVPAVDCVLGGDPCPKHSRARSNGTSTHPDLSGYFLAVVGRYGPEWVVRENVPSPTVATFAACLEALGYGTVIVRVDADTLTGQSRQRDIIVGCRSRTGESLRRVFPDCENGRGSYTTRLGTRPIIPALTTHRTRYDSRDGYIYESGRLRILDAPEREALAGAPVGWTSGFSQGARARMLGNSGLPQWTEWLGRRIVEADKLATEGQHEIGENDETMD